MEIAQWNEHNIDYNAVSIENFLLILIEIRGVVFGRFALIVMAITMGCYGGDDDDDGDDDYDDYDKM